MTEKDLLTIVQLLIGTPARDTVAIQEIQHRAEELLGVAPALEGSCYDPSEMRDVDGRTIY